MEHAAECAGFFADVDDLTKQRREELARACDGQRQRISTIDRVADVLKIAAHAWAGRLGLALPGAADVDARLGLDGQPMAEFTEVAGRESW